MKAAKYKMMGCSLFLGGVLSLVLLPAFAGNPYGGEEEGAMGKQEMHKEMHKKWFQKLDKDGDGKVTEEEFEEAMEEKFERMDKNDDDSITLEEWQAAAKKHKKEHRRGAPEGSGGQEGM